MIFIKIGYHPIAGLNGLCFFIRWFWCKLLIGMQDALVYAFTEPATKIVSDSVKINVAMNWYFIAASVILVLPVIYFTTTKVVIPRLGEYDASQANYDEEEETSSHITPTEKKALFWANMSFLLLIVALIICCIQKEVG